MGDIADMMLDGTLCIECGEFMGGSGDGFPVKCPGCRRKSRNGELKVECPRCNRRVSAIGMTQHLKDKHGVSKPFEQPK